MGHGIALTCKCGKKENIKLGVGMMFPHIFEDILEDINKGVYGDEWKNLYQSKEYMVVDAEKYLFYCKDCGHWETALNLDMYEPNNEDEIRHLQFGKKTVEEWGSIPYITHIHIENYYHLAKEYVRKCPKCDAAMEKTNDLADDIFNNLPCKKCGKKIRKKKFLLWD